MQEVYFSTDQKFKKILIGLNKTADAVSGTLGPKGRNVLLGDPLMPHITNDGATIANSIKLKDELEDLGRWTLANTSAQTNDDAGDGTTTTAVLLQAIIAESLKRPENPMVIKNSLQEACRKIIDKLKEVSTPITLDDIKKVALISSESEEIADLVTGVISRVGVSGVIVVEESKTFETSSEIQEGYECNNGFMSPVFATNKEQTKAEYDNILVLVSQKKINTITDIKPLFDQLDVAKISQIILVCEDINPEILGVLAFNKVQGRLGIVAIKTVGTQLEDIAAITGATLISESSGVGFHNLEIDKHLGRAEKVISSSKKTLFVAHHRNSTELAARLQIDLSEISNIYQKEESAKRIAKLTGGIAIIRVGAATDLDRVYRKHKTDDTVAACKAALEEGIVEGGGMALWRIASELEPTTVGEEILKKALTAPLRKICDNAGLDYTEIVSKMPEGFGYDAKDNNYAKMIETDIIDPTKVERVALTNAVSNASQFITMHAVVAETKDK